MELVKGAFVVIEGVDGVGKTEQAKRFKEALDYMNISAILTKTPGEMRPEGLVGSTLGPIVRDVLFSDKYVDVGYESKSMLLLADHLLLVEEVIKPAVAAKCIVVSDRFMDSQFATWNKPAEDPVNQTFSRFYRCIPDLTFLLTGDPTECFERASNRGSQDNEKQSNKPWNSVEALNQIQENYKHLVVNSTIRRVVTIDTIGKDIDEVHNEVVESFTEWLVENQYLLKESQET